ncbi:Hypp1135 [Branchiostoma lanceolatum]|uniref:Hypp1135 protein n=1 Tax=Branchiostoma lanceolatum TaxID=7740 RepID=A0A8K0EJ43_BRALA|nr:Hypp1135 [Branchiostoma lanceolatum]
MPDVLYTSLHSIASAHPVEWLRWQATIALDFYFCKLHPYNPGLCLRLDPHPPAATTLSETGSPASMSPRSEMSSPVSESTRTEMSTPTAEIDQPRTPCPVRGPGSDTGVRPSHAGYPGCIYCF